MEATKKDRMNGIKEMNKSLEYQQWQVFKTEVDKRYKAEITTPTKNRTNENQKEPF